MFIIIFSTAEFVRVADAVGEVGRSLALIQVEESHIRYKRFHLESIKQASRGLDFNVIYLDILINATNIVFYLDKLIQVKIH